MVEKATYLTCQQSYINLRVLLHNIGNKRPCVSSGNTVMRIHAFFFLYVATHVKEGHVSTLATVVEKLTCLLWQYWPGRSHVTSGNSCEEGMCVSLGNDGDKSRILSGNTGEELD